MSGVRELVLFGFGLDKPPGHKIYQTSRMHLLKNKKQLFCLISYFIQKMMNTNQLEIIDKR